MQWNISLHVISALTGTVYFTGRQRQAACSTRTSHIPIAPARNLGDCNWSYFCCCCCCFFIFIWLGVLVQNWDCKQGYFPLRFLFIQIYICTSSAPSPATTTAAGTWRYSPACCPCQYNLLKANLAWHFLHPPAWMGAMGGGHCVHTESSVERASFSNNLKFRANNWHHTDHRLQHAAAEEDKHRRHGPTYVQLHSTNPILTVGVTGQEPQLCGNTWEWGGWSFSKAAVGLWGCLVVAPLGLGI